jgi:hypothetical protein
MFSDSMVPWIGEANCRNATALGVSVATFVLLLVRRLPRALKQFLALLDSVEAILTGWKIRRIRRQKGLLRAERALLRAKREFVEAERELKELGRNARACRRQSPARKRALLSVQTDERRRTSLR